MPNKSIPFSSVFFADRQTTHPVLSRCPRQPLIPDGARTTLPCPCVEEADPPDVLDPSRVFETVHVQIRYPEMARNDVLTVYWHGTNPLGRIDSELTLPQVAQGQPVRLAVGADFVMPNMGQRVRVSYTVWRAATQAYEYSSTLHLLVRELVA